MFAQRRICGSDRTVLWRSSQQSRPCQRRLCAATSQPAHCQVAPRPPAEARARQTMSLTPVRTKPQEATPATQPWPLGDAGCRIGGRGPTGPGQYGPSPDRHLPTHASTLPPHLMVAGLVKSVAGEMIGNRIARTAVPASERHCWHGVVQHQGQSDSQENYSGPNE